MADNVKPIERAKDLVAETVEKTRGAVNDGLDAARERFDDVADDLGKKYQRAAKEVRRTAGRASSAAREKYDAAAEVVRDGYARASKDFERLSKDVSEYVRDNPGKALLMAAGVGFVVGLLFRRDRDE